MVTTSKTSAFALNDLSIIVKTGNQGVYNQPCLWLIHGSGGISSNEDIWIERAFEEGYSVIMVDSYSNRGIFKQNWESLDEYRIPPYQRAQDQVSAFEFLEKKNKILPFLDLSKSKAVGFSDGGTASIWLQSSEFSNYWSDSYSLYPGLKPTAFTPEMYNIRKDNVHVFVGELDNWTPAFYCVDYQKITGCKLTIWPDTHHSFSKPGIDNWHEKTLNYNREPGVYCKYNAESTRKTMDIVFQ